MTTGRSGVLEGVGAHGYNGVWKLWKLGSLGLFTIFVAAFVDAARTLRRIERKHTPAGRALLFAEWDRGFEAGRQIERICAEMDAAEYLEAHEVRR